MTTCYTNEVTRSRVTLLDRVTLFVLCPLCLKGEDPTVGTSLHTNCIVTARVLDVAHKRSD